MTPPGDDEPSDGADESDEEWSPPPVDDSPDQSTGDGPHGSTPDDATGDGPHSSTPDDPTSDEPFDDATSEESSDTAPGEDTDEEWADESQPGQDPGGETGTFGSSAGSEQGEMDSRGGTVNRASAGEDTAGEYGRAREERVAADDEDEDDGLGWRAFVTDIVTSIVAVLLVGALLFAVSGVWPPLVAVESPSMDPHMKKGDLVFVMEEHRFPGENAHGDTGVVTLRAAADDYVKFQKRGDVIVYEPNGDASRVPIIHRAMFWVEKGERWYDEANREYVGSASNCEELSHCPAKHAGFITKGDNNPVYDQVRGLDPVKPSWVVGTAEVRIPALGWVRLRSSKGLQQVSNGGVAADVTAANTTSPGTTNTTSPGTTNTTAAASAGG